MFLNLTKLFCCWKLLIICAFVAKLGVDTADISYFDDILIVRPSAKSKEGTRSRTWKSAARLRCLPLLVLRFIARSFTTHMTQPTNLLRALREWSGIQTHTRILSYTDRYTTMCMRMLRLSLRIWIIHVLQIEIARICVVLRTRLRILIQPLVVILVLVLKHYSYLYLFRLLRLYLCISVLIAYVRQIRS